MKLSYLFVAAISLVASLAHAETRLVLIEAKRGPEQQPLITIHSDEKKEQVRAIPLADALPIVDKMQGWGSIVIVYVDVNDVRGRDLRALLLTITRNAWLELEYFGPDVPRDIAAKFAPPAISPEKQIEPPPLPEKTPFDGDGAKRVDYQRSYREGFVWAEGVHLACPTNPSDTNLHAIRGWIEGWQAGVKAGGQSDLPAKYASFIAWKGSEPAQPKLPDGARTEWDFSKFPKLTGKVIHELGSMSSYIPPEVGDGFTLELNGIGGLDTLQFDLPSKSYIPLALMGPLTLERVNTYTTGDFANCRFVAAGNDERVTVDVQGNPGGKRPVTIWITREYHGLTSGVVVVKCPGL